MTRLVTHQRTLPLTTSRRFTPRFHTAFRINFTAGRPCTRGVLQRRLAGNFRAKQDSQTRSTIHIHTRNLISISRPSDAHRRIHPHAHTSLSAHGTTIKNHTQSHANTHRHNHTHMPPSTRASPTQLHPASPGPFTQIHPASPSEILGDNYG